MEKVSDAGREAGGHEGGGDHGLDQDGGGFDSEWCDDHNFRCDAVPKADGIMAHTLPFRHSVGSYPSLLWLLPKTTISVVLEPFVHDVQFKEAYVVPLSSEYSTAPIQLSFVGFKTLTLMSDV